LALLALPNRVITGISEKSGWAGLGAGGQLWSSPTLLGLSMQSDVDSTPEVSFSSAFHRYVRNYPFVDYSKASARGDEEALLDAYAELGPSPSIALGQSGEPVRLESLLQETRLVAEAVSETLRPTGVVRTRHALLYRRKVPSGGCRHPMEAYIAVGDTPGRGGGIMFFDLDTQTLRWMDPDRIEQHALEVPSPGSLAVLLHAHVERAMWRYREPRSWRAVLLDAGHLAECLVTEINARGVDLQVEYPLADRTLVSANPILARLSRRSDATAERRDVVEAEQASGERLAWNPFAVVDVRPVRALFGKVVNTGHTRDLTTHWGALEGLCGRPNIASEEAPQELVDAGVLMGIGKAGEIAQAVDLWTRHNWMLPLLAHVEELVARKSVEVGMPSDRVRGSLATLSRRRTHRAFQQETFRLDRVQRLLATGAQHRIESGIDVVVWLSSTEQIALYSFEGTSGRLMFERMSTRAELDEIVVHQPGIRNAPCVVVMRSMHFGASSGYEQQIIELGRSMQKLVLQATSMGLRTFTTPALRDSLVEEWPSPRSIEDDVVGYALALEEGVGK